MLRESLSRWISPLGSKDLLSFLCSAGETKIAARSAATPGRMPPNFKACKYCAQQFGSASLSIHEQRCRHRPELAAEHELRNITVKTRCPGIAGHPRLDAPSH